MVAYRGLEWKLFNAKPLAIADIIYSLRNDWKRIKFLRSSF